MKMAQACLDYAPSRLDSGTSEGGLLGKQGSITDTQKLMALMIDLQ